MAQWIKKIAGHCAIYVDIWDDVIVSRLVTLI